MLTLSIDTTAKTATAALTDKTELAQFSVNNTLTHSENLLFMVDALLKTAGKTVSDVKRLAVSAGPGSFTGVRIGIAAIKGLAFGKDIPIAAVSTLDALAHNVSHTGDLIFACMDARREQTYFAIFASDGEKTQRLTEDSAKSIPEALEKLCEICEKNNKKSVIFVGDGAVLCYNAFAALNKSGISGKLAPEHLRFQSAFSVAKAAEKYFESGETVSDKTLDCVYLRRPQADM